MVARVEPDGPDRRLAGMRRWIRLSLPLVVLIGLAGCAAVGGGSAAPTVDATAAARLVLAQDPRFAGIPARDDKLIGQANWYVVVPAADGWDVTVRMGWGDCPAGCIGQHRWEYHVSRAADVRRTGESGDALPSGIPGAAPGISGIALAGPTCPVQRYPPAPRCAERPVAGAVVVAEDQSGRQVAKTTTRGDGTFALAVGPGTYRLVPQPVPGMLGTAQPAEITVLPDQPTPIVTLSYDTGIR